MKFATEKERCDFILANKALVHYCLPPHIRDGKCIDDLEQEGFIGLILAVDRFDPSRNIKFSTYAIQYIDGYMRTFNNKNTLIKPLRNHFRNAGEASYLYKEITSIDRPHGYGEHATSLVNAIPDPQSTDYFHDGISIKEMTEIVPKHCKSLVKLICTEDLSQKKLAEKLGVSRPCISRRCKAIREALIAAGYIEVYILECDKENDPENFPGE